MPTPSVNGAREDSVQKCLLWCMLLLAAVAPAGAQSIRVNPSGVNVNAGGATVVFLTYGGLGNYVPTEAQWCGELVDAFPAFGQKCEPSTLFGQLPLRHDLSRSSGSDAFTDIMSIPPSVSRRAYQAAQRGTDSRFFYVRRFVEPFSAAPDVYVAVTCRLAGSGARTPFALLDVQLRFGSDAEVLALKQGDVLPPLAAEISYNGTGSLRGRWEVVLPGEEPPTDFDLLTEATLPIEERVLQRRYTEIGRFSVFLPPSTGARFELPGPDPERFPRDVEGLYMVLLRVEASDDKEGDSNLAAIGAGDGVVHGGAVAGFPLPPLRYFIGNDASHPAPVAAGRLRQLHPGDDERLTSGATLDFSWTAVPQAVLFRLEILSAADERVLAAMLPASRTDYRAPPWLYERVAGGALRWRVAALGLGGHELTHTPWRSLQIHDTITNQPPVR